jgi:hypothetical protein
MRVRGMKIFRLVSLACFCSLVILSCGQAAESGSKLIYTPAITPLVNVVDRTVKIPIDAIKMVPASDEHPPLLHADDYQEPVPLPGKVNTAGAEDSPFITPGGSHLYFFFTPSVDVPVEQQLLDGVTGIYVSEKVDGGWGEARRVNLQEPGKLALDGCEYIMGDVMWFCTTREGYTGIHWFTAEYVQGLWQNWKVADFDPAYQVGELYIAPGGKELYFGSERPGGEGGLDIWTSVMVAGVWQEPVNISAVNTADSEGWPATNLPGDELWFARNYGIWRSKRVGGEWQEAELVISSLAGEPTLDEQGNLYFVHHFFIGDRMIEADIYVANKR